jgi:hypothetical protein
MVWGCIKEDNFQKNSKQAVFSASLRLCVKKEPVQLLTINNVKLSFFSILREERAIPAVVHPSRP